MKNALEERHKIQFKKQTKAKELTTIMKLYSFSVTTYQAVQGRYYTSSF